jgi:molecular chaperone DnaK
VTIHVLQGEREMTRDNKSLGQFNLTDIPAAARGTPQIEVTFDIDSNGILHVSAKDKATGKENKITIKANSGLAEDEIEAMIKDAETHAEDDRKAREVVDARNECDALVHGVRKSLAEHGEKLDAEEKGKIEQALTDAEEAIKGNDKDEIQAQSQALAAASQKLAEQMNAQEQQASQSADSSAGGSSGQAAEDDGNVVDAEFEEVKDNKKSA